MKATIRNIKKLSLRRGVVATCREHPWERFSATPGDYFWATDSDVLRCPQCNEPLTLATFVEVMREA